MTTPLDQAPPEIQLAVDLIMLLEQHQLAPPLVLKALAIVTADYQKKAMTMPTSPSTLNEDH